MKKCLTCKIEKELTKFHKKSDAKDGLYPHCKKCVEERNKKYNKDHRKEISVRKKNHYEEHKKDPIFRKKRTEQAKEKRKNDPVYRLFLNIRRRFHFYLNGNKKSKRTFEYINCTKEELVLHLESLFQEGMTWENYGEWHIDHIRPLSSFDPKKEEDMYKAWNKDNLQPLWAVDNLKKYNNCN